MKSFTLSLLIVFVGIFSLQAQPEEEYYVNKVPLSAINAPYIEIEICNKPLSRMMYLYIDYGQQTELISRQNQRLANAKNNFVEFNSNMDALNYLDSVGFELVTASYAVVDQASNPRLICILKRKQKN